MEEPRIRETVWKPTRYPAKKTQSTRN